MLISFRLFSTSNYSWYKISFRRCWFSEADVSTHIKGVPSSPCQLSAQYYFLASRQKYCIERFSGIKSRALFCSYFFSTHFCSSSPMKWEFMLGSKGWSFLVCKDSLFLVKLWKTWELVTHPICWQHNETIAIVFTTLKWQKKFTLKKRFLTSNFRCW